MSIGAKTFILLTPSQKNMAATTVLLALDIQRKDAPEFSDRKNMIYNCLLV